MLGMERNEEKRDGGGGGGGGGGSLLQPSVRGQRTMSDGRSVRTDSSAWNGHRFVGLVIKASTSGAEDPGFESRLRQDFSGSSHTINLKTGTLVATLPGAWRDRVSAGTGRPGVSIL